MFEVTTPIPHSLASEINKLRPRSLHPAMRWLALTWAAIFCPVFAWSAAPSIYSVNPASTHVGYNFSLQIQALNSPTNYGASGLPAGLAINAQSGVISGRPQVGGQFSIGLSATNADGTDTASLALTVDPAPTAAPVILNQGMFDSTHENFNYEAYPSFLIQATNSPESYGATGLPAGVYFDSTKGQIFSNDAVPGLYDVTLSATNPLGTGSLEIAWAVHPMIQWVWVDKRVYNTGDIITVQLHFDGPVNVTGTPLIPLASAWGDQGVRQLRFAGGSGTTTLTFTFQTGPNDFNPGDIRLGALDLNGGSMAHPSGVSARTAFPREQIGNPPPVLHIVGPPVITSAATASGTVGMAFSYAITAMNWPSSYGALNLPAGLNVDSHTGVISGTPLASGSYAVTLQVFNQFTPTPTTANLALTVSGAAAGQSASQVVSPGSTVTFTTATAAPNPTFQWQFDGVNIPGATGATFSLDAAGPANTGIYTALISANGQVSSTVPATLGLMSTAKVLGNGQEVGSDIVHVNGNIYDQVLLQGAAATVTADAGQVLRMSFVDLNDDIVQVEFSGAGTLSVVLDAPSGPAQAASYNQPTVSYMKGHAGLVIAGANETTNVSVFSVGRITALNQALFRDNVSYDGVADIAFISILSANGKFGGLRASNASLWATRGVTGINAPGVQFTGPVYVGDISAMETATPILLTGSAGDVRITGGDLTQLNGAAVQVSGVTQVQFVDGTTSQGTTLPALSNRGRLEQGGRDVTSEIVANPH